jgi:hypothetical protein
MVVSVVVSVCEKISDCVVADGLGTDTVTLMDKIPSSSIYIT